MVGPLKKPPPQGGEEGLEGRDPDLRQSPAIMLHSPLLPAVEQEAQAPPSSFNPLVSGCSLRWAEAPGLQVDSWQTLARPMPTQRPQSDELAQAPTCPKLT